MFEVFESLHHDKKKRILDACMAEFAKNGYKDASTNEIVKAAGISKGILFHYFGNKKNLYLYVLDYIINYTMVKFYSNPGELPADLFERCLHMAVLKLRIALDEPLIYEIIYKTFVNTPEELKEDVTERYMKLYRDDFPALFKSLDTSKFRKGMDPQKGIDVLLCFLDGYYNKCLTLFRNRTAEEALLQMESITKEGLGYLDILKKGIYED